MSRWRKEHAFSVVDLLIVVAICGILCGFAVAGLSGARTGVIDARLQSDIDTINYAINVFRAKGGSLEGLSDPNAILARLKDHQEKREESLVQFLGAPDHMIDPDLSARTTDQANDTGHCSRAVWDPETHCFKLAQEGRGAKEFFVNRK